MSKVMNKLMLCSASLLMALSISSPAMAERTNYSHNRIHTTKIRKHLTIRQRAIKDAKHDEYHYLDGQDSLYGYGYITKHPHWFKNKKYFNAYYPELLKQAKIYGHQAGDSMDGIYAVKALPKYYRSYLKMSNYQKKSFQWGVKGGTMFTQLMPKKYRHSLTFAKYYLKGTIYSDDVQGYTHEYLHGNDIQTYYDQGGKVPLRKLVNKNWNKIMKISNRVALIEHHGVYSLKQEDRLDNKIINKYKHSFSHYYLGQLKKALNNQYITIYLKDSTYAKDIYNKYPFHRDFYYSNNIPGSKEGGSMQGVMIGLHNNKATHNTLNNARKYLYSYQMKYAEKVLEDDDEGGKVNPKYTKYINNWHKNYQLSKIKSGKYKDDYVFKQKHNSHANVLYILGGFDSPYELTIKD